MALSAFRMMMSASGDGAFDTSDVASDAGSSSIGRVC
jgi:hypothetical protein